MQPVRRLFVCCLSSLCLLGVSDRANGDFIKFKRGAKKQCVVIEEDETWVTFLTPMGEMKMPCSRVESIEREPEEVNEALMAEWADKNTARSEGQNEEEENEEEQPRVRRTYKIEIRKRRVMLGARTAGIKDAQLVASFKVTDLGTIEGSHLFHVTVTSFRSIRTDVSPPDFHALTKDGMRINPHPLKGYEDLKASLALNETASGHVAFPTTQELGKLVFSSALAEFELDLETGDYDVKGGFF